MKESAEAAYSCFLTRATELGLKEKDYKDLDIHLHVPEGAIPKDGPSAGITMFTSLASIFTQRKVKDKLAMTGEITLRGKVLPVGGIREKVLAARRAGIKDVLLSSRNRRDIENIDEHYLKGLNVHYVDTVDQVMEIALMKSKVDNPVKFILPELRK